jgi:hypothetical protein
MSFILVPQAGEDIQINAWNWRATLELLRAEGLVNQDEIEDLGTHGAGDVDDGLALRIADAIEGKLAAMQPGERMRADLTVVSTPKPRHVFRADGGTDDIDVNELYSANYEWLVEFKDFCRRSGGFRVL